jgi:outer membrane protein
VRWSYLDPNEIEKKIIKSAKHLFVILLLVGLGLVPCIAKCDGLDLELAQKLILEGKPVEAYALLEPYEFEQAGNTKFDYLLGLAALNSGQADKASIILERVVAVDPLHAAARVDLGRAYYLLGDSERARVEFTRALSLNPPPPALAMITQYLNAMETPDNRPMTRLSGYFEAGAGYNNNVNNSTAESQIYVPALLGTQFSLNASNVKTADNYLGLAGGGEAIHTFSPDWSVYAGADLHSRNDLKYSNFDFISLDGRFGASFSKNAEQFQGGLVVGQFNQGGAVNRNYNGLNAEWRHTYNSTNQGILFSQYILYRYPNPALASNNFNQAIAGLGWMHVFTDGRSSVFSCLFGGNEQATNLRIDGAKSIQGVRLSVQSSLVERLDLFASGGMQSGKFNQINSAFLVIRDDRQADLAVGLIYRYAPNWILRPQISLIRNQSNIIIDQYNQVDLSLTLRRDFK